MTDQGKRPLLTAFIIAYNQEQFVQAAINGVLSQTYSPLEVIFSDDCSTDRTFDLMRASAVSYVGPHKVRLNQNVTNVGIGAHINKVMSMASGELVIAGAGDDVSLPFRVDEIFDRWEKEGRPECVIYSCANKIDSEGKIIGRLDAAHLQEFDMGSFISGEKWTIAGYSESWHRDIFHRFGPLVDGVVNEDVAILFRGALLDKICYIEKPLLNYRVHDTNISTGGFSDDLDGDAWLDRVKAGALHADALSRNHMRDLQRYRGEAPGSEDESLREVEQYLRNRAELIATTIGLCAAKGIARYSYAIRYWKLGSARADRRAMLRMLWPRTYRYVRKQVRRLRMFQGE